MAGFDPRDQYHWASLASAGALHVALLLLLLLLYRPASTLLPERPPLQIEVIPVPLPPPPPPEQVVEPPRVKIVSREVSGGSAEPRGAPPAIPEQVDRTIAPLAPRAAAPVPTPALRPSTPLLPLSDGTGSGSGNGGGSGSGGTGTGSGAGAGSGSGLKGKGANRGPEWIYKPDEIEMRRFNPPAAARNAVSGSVLLSCLISPANVPTDCRVVREQPRGMRFGRAALSAAGICRVRAPVIDGRSRHDVRVEIPVEFRNRRLG